ncbi:MAG: VWA domain-containing protein [Selenomonadaceae bacterium]|nr:VWA domain-containing protein [Selenomonadaceae bacterium]
MKVERGVRDNLEKFFDISKPLKVTLKISGKATYDFTCFGVDAKNKLSDDRYMIFYNQTQSPRGEIRYNEISNGAEFFIDLETLPSTVQRLVFTASIDGAGSMGEISTHDLTIEQGDKEKVTAQFGGRDFQNEKAITSLEIYRKNNWRFQIVARGFDGGLDKLLEFYGGEQIQDDTVNTKSDIQPTPTKPKKISLEKKIQEGAPKLISLVKPLKVELEKRNLQETVAKVALVMDISGSMYSSYENGTVQEIVNKIVPIAVQFDDDGELDFWYYGSICRRMDSVTLLNYERAVPSDWSDLMNRLECGNYEPAVMREVINEYQNSEFPAYIVFISDGGVGSADEIKSLIISSSKMPIFWQFVGIGGNGFFSRLFGSGYGIFEKLDTLEGRYVDNTNFFALDDFRNVDNSELYSRLLNEFPNWLKAARSKNIIR